MGMKKACDVFGTTADVQTFEISVTRADDSTVEAVKADLSPRALCRLLTKLRAGITEPPRKAK